MSSSSGIPASEDLTACFANAVASNDVRVIKVSIRNEQLVEDGTWPRSGDLLSDFEHVASYVEDSTPAYILVRLDTAEWLAISYVPDTAKVRDKMLYASTQSALKRALGESRFKDSIFATSKADLTPEAYSAHLKHISAPKPLSSREEEMANLRAAERAAGLNAYEGSQTRRSHVGLAQVGFKWSDEVESAFGELKEAGETSLAVVICIDTDSESLSVREVKKSIKPEELGSIIPTSDPSYTFYSWPHQNNQEQVTSIVVIYCSPDDIPVKQRMVASSALGPLVNDLKQQGIIVVKRTETSDPKEIDTTYLLQALGHHAAGAAPTTERVAFAKPRGPPRRR